MLSVMIPMSGELSILLKFTGQSSTRIVPATSAIIRPNHSTRQNQGSLRAVYVPVSQLLKGERTLNKSDKRWSHDVVHRHSVVSWKIWSVDAWFTAPKHGARVNGNMCHAYLKSKARFEGVPRPSRRDPTTASSCLSKYGWCTHAYSVTINWLGPTWSC